jgi:hypothetical protein
VRIERAAEERFRAANEAKPSTNLVIGDLAEVTAAGAQEKKKSKEQMSINLST